MSIKLVFKKRMCDGHEITQLTHIKVMDENGKYIKFAKHTDKNIEAISQLNLKLNNLELELN